VQTGEDDIRASCLDRLEGQIAQQERPERHMPSRRSNITS
jgi:hypothetical protein